MYGYPEIAEILNAHNAIENPNPYEKPLNTIRLLKEMGIDVNIVTLDWVLKSNYICFFLRVKYQSYNTFLSWCPNISIINIINVRNSIYFSHDLWFRNISGYPGCISVNKDYSQNNPKFSTAEDPSIHYSGIKFENPVIIDGNSPMPAPSLNVTIPEYGHTGNGHVIISTARKYDDLYFSRITAIPYKVKCSIPLKVGHNFDIFFTLSIVYLSLG